MKITRSYFSSVALALTILLSPLVSQAVPREETPDENWRFSLGAAYVNKLSKRGLVTYNGDQLLPVISLNLGSPRFFISGLTLNYKMTPLNDLTLRLRLNGNSTYDDPLYTSQESLDARPQRQKTSEGEFFWEWVALPWLEINGGLSQDLIAHKGFFADLGFRLILGNFKDNLIEPAIFASKGVGNLAHNEYLYGVGALEGSAVETLGLSIAAPSKVDAFYPILKISKSWLHTNIRNGAFVRPNEIENFQVLLWGAVRVR